ncbi:substrate-binding periplasmic protein [Rhodovibrionaceae bacterium A322]
MLSVVRAFSLVLTLSLVFWGLPADADNNTSQSSASPTTTTNKDSSPTLVAGVFELAPYYLAGSPGMPGMFVDALAALSERSGIALQLKTAPVNRVIKGYRQGSVDLTIVLGDLLPALSAETVFPSTPLVVLGSSQVPITEVSDLNQTTITSPSDAASGALQAFAADQQFNTVLIKDYEIAVRMLDKGRVDGVLGVWPTLNYAARTSGVSLNGTPLIVKDLRLVLSLSPYGQITPDLQQKLEAARLSLELDGTFVRIYHKYLGRPLAGYRLQKPG